MQRLLISLAMLLYMSFGSAVARAHSLADPRLPVDHWAYAVCDYFVESDIVPGYAADFFDGSEPRHREEFAGFVTILFDVLAQTDASDDPRLALFDLEQLKSQLFEQFKYSLSVTRVRPLDTEAAWPGRPSFFGGLLQLTSRDFPVTELIELMDTYPVDDTNHHQMAYEDVPRDAPWYSMLAEASRAGALEGYPEGFFEGERTLTRYEFGQALARMLGHIEETDYGWWNPNLEQAEEAGFERRKIAELVLEFAPELEELDVMIGDH